MEQTMTLKPIWGFLTRFTLVHFVTYWIFGLLFFYSSRVSWALCTTRNRHFYASHHFNLGICWSTFSAHQRTNHGLGDIPLPQGFPSWKEGMDVALGIIHRARNPLPSRTNPWLNRRYRLHRVTPPVPFNWLTWSSATNAGSFIPILLLGTATRGEENIDSTPRNLHCDTCAYYTWNSIWRSYRLMKPIRSCPKCKGEMELGRIYPMLLMFLRRQRITERIWLRLMPPPKFPSQNFRYARNVIWNCAPT